MGRKWFGKLSVLTFIAIIISIVCPTFIKSALAANNIGINTENYWMWPIQFDEEKFEPYISAIQNSGVEYVRIFAHWSALQANQATWQTKNVDRLDRILSKIKQAGIEPVVVFFNPPSWASLSPDGNNRDDYLISDIEAWKEFVRVMADRYGYAEEGLQYVKYWEVLNEPDLPSRQYTASDYYNLLKETYPVIKQADPSSTVLVGGLSQLGWRDFLPELLNQGGGEFFDILSMHIYHKPDDVTLPLLKFKEILQNNGISKPIWVTEVNWGRMNYLTSFLEDKCPQPDDEDKWLRFKDYFNNLLDAGAEKVFWHQARCSIWGPGFIEQGSELPDSESLTIREKSFQAFKEATGTQLCAVANFSCLLSWRVQLYDQNIDGKANIVDYFKVLKEWLE